MKRRHSDAIVLHTSPSRERDKLVVFLTPDRGKMRGWAYGARSLRSRYGAALEPLSRVRFHWMEKETEDTVRLESAELVRSLFSAQQRLDASVAGTWLAELTDTFIQVDEPAELPFRLLDSCCRGLIEGLPPELVILYFEIWILRLTGIFPSLEECIDCGAELGVPLHFDAGRAGFVCGKCGGRADLVSRDVRDEIVRILRTSVTEFAANPPAARLRRELRALARDIRRHFLGHELRSWTIVQGLVR